jgi:hypothetical protein
MKTANIYLLLALVLLVTACTPQFSQGDCLRLQAGYNYETGRSHCCEVALWNMDLKNTSTEFTMETAAGNLIFKGMGLFQIDIKGKKLTHSYKSLTEQSNILATHLRRSHCPACSDSCAAPYIKNRINAVGQIVFAEISDGEVGLALKDLLNSIGFNANFNATTKTVTSTTGSFCFMFPATHEVCEGFASEAPPGVGYFFDSTILTQLTPAEKAAQKALAEASGVPIGKPH